MAIKNTNIKPFLIFLKNKFSAEFEYKKDVSNIVYSNNRFKITFSNNRDYIYSTDNVRYYKYISTKENVCIYEKGKRNKAYNIVDNYGRYLIFRNNNSQSEPVYNNRDIEICELRTNFNRIKSIIGYFKDILIDSGGASFDIPDGSDTMNSNKISNEILIRALNKLDLSDTRSALSNFLEGTNPKLEQNVEKIIYPFGCNESQKHAVETAMANSMSIVEGPPGTGKTQTILNIIANLIINNKTVAIVSNNNSAVFNIMEKLTKYGYELIVASLGNNENKQSFFEKISEQTFCEEYRMTEDQFNESKNRIHHLNAIVNKCFTYRNKLSILKTKLLDSETEFNHIESEQPISSKVKEEINNKFLRKWDYKQALKLKALLYGTEQKLSLINKLKLIFIYGLFDLRILNSYKSEFFAYVNHKFYELYIENLKKEIDLISEWLKYNNEESNLKQFTKVSMDIFNGFLFEKYQNIPNEKFTVDDYRARFDEFIKHYPVLLSSTLSLKASIPEGFLFDYLIIDESSQVDIIKSAVCFDCCRNVVVVGDSKQLTHIIDNEKEAIAVKLKEAYNINAAYDYVRNNILSSLKTLYGDKIKTTLLKEHYRCHPKIIDYCNKRYYNNELIIMTDNDSNPFTIIETNISGNRGFYNQRQIDETISFINEKYSDSNNDVGVIAPYREHVNMLQKQLPYGVEADTIHKYQGREKDIIIFNTVRNEIGEFIDNPNLINVAVSRAVKEFVIVKPELMELI